MGLCSSPNLRIDCVLKCLPVPPARLSLASNSHLSLCPRGLERRLFSSPHLCLEETMTAGEAIMEFVNVQELI